MQHTPRSGRERPTAAPDNLTDKADAVSNSTNPEDDVVIPVIAEEASVETVRVARGTVRVHKRIETHEHTVALPHVHEEVVVERIPVDRRVEGPPPQPREEGGVLVIPVLEEIAVIERRLILREEVRVSFRSTTTTESRPVTLRREVVDVERVTPDMAATTTRTSAGESERPAPGVDPEQDAVQEKKGGGT